MADVIPLRPRRAGPTADPRRTEPPQASGRPAKPPQYEGLFLEPVLPPVDEPD